MVLPAFSPVLVVLQTFILGSRTRMFQQLSQRLAVKHCDRRGRPHSSCLQRPLRTLKRSLIFMLSSQCVPSKIIILYSTAFTVWCCMRVLAVSSLVGRGSTPASVGIEAQVASGVPPSRWVSAPVKAAKVVEYEWHGSSSFWTRPSIDGRVMQSHTVTV